MKLTHARQKHTVMSLFISHCEPPIRNNQPGYNNHPHSHAVKLPDGRSGQIRFSFLSQLSGSVPRSGNKQSALFRW
ncbi:hypothetical protein NU37_21275 [Salmonella enterica subsp. enterica serovar Montevideo]|nr:hypothetical protein [Salmonella enterica subsp. enterica serovar Montevideo]EDL1275134.1 hypothetical protein [Salmonella enterica subsp. enterica serovar Montevideo]